MQASELHATMLLKQGGILVDQSLYENHLAVLRSNLQLALGCTEPIAAALAAAKAREVLGAMPSRMTLDCSGNIIKNVNGVVVPHSNGMKGVDGSRIRTGWWKAPSAVGSAGGYHRQPYR